MRNLTINASLAHILARRIAASVLRPLAAPRFRAPRAPSGRFLPVAWAVGAEAFSASDLAFFRSAVVS